MKENATMLGLRHKPILASLLLLGIVLYSVLILASNRWEGWVSLEDSWNDLCRDAIGPIVVVRLNTSDCNVHAI